MTGKTVVITVRVTEPVAAAIDKARSGQSRSAWVEASIRDSLGADVFYGKAAKGKRDSDACPPHPRGRVIKGFCYRCGKPAA